jgi:hypothetical protein
MLYPVTLLLTETIEIAKSIKTKHKIDHLSYLKIAKALVLLYLTSQLLVVLATYSGIGLVCLFIGTSAIAIASNDEILKSTMPAIAPQLSKLDLVVSTVTDAQASLLAALQPADYPRTLPQASPLNEK